MARRYGAGSVYQRSRDGKWVATWEVTGDGKRKRRSVVGDTSAQAERRMQAAKLKGSSSKSRQPTESVGAYLERWLDDVVRRTRRERTVVGYRAIVRGVPVLVASQPLDSRDLAHEIQAWLNGLDRHPRTVHHYAACLRTAFGYAVRKGLMDRNPAVDLDLPAIPRTERIPLTVPEMHQWLSVAAQSQADVRTSAHGEPLRTGGFANASAVVESGVSPAIPAGGSPDPFYPLWLTAAWTGMRQGELLGLRWEDVSLDRGSLVVRSSLTRLPGPKGVRYVITEPKTERSRRTVPLTEAVVTVLRELRKTDLATTKQVDQGLVFCTPNGSAWDASVVTRRFWASLKRAGVRKVRFHDLRHTAATLMIQSGMDLPTVSGILGHSNIGTTVDLYGHVTELHRREAMDRFAKWVVG